jgi:uncharacterized protein YvpB
MTNFKFSKLNIALIIFTLGAIVAIIFITKYYTAKIPTTLILQVPFSPQAPNQNWSRNEDCEETSITMANAFLTGSTEDKLPINAAQNAINNLKRWEGENLGYNANTGVDATTKMAEGAFNLHIQQIENYTADDLKKALVKGHPILLPINAKLLKSAQYEDNGPTYHMIVIRGFRDNTFIVNDPGTNKGNGNEFSFEELKNAGADWNQMTKTIDPNSKIALVVSK